MVQASSAGMLWACCARIVPALCCVLVMGMLWVSVTIPFCRPGADAGERQGRILSMKAVQDPSVCWLAMVPNAIRTKPVLACCKLLLFYLLCLSVFCAEH
jgi:hypothetical protein